MKLPFLPSPPSSRSARPTAAPAPALNLHIGRLSLRGVSSAEGSRIEVAFKGELRRLMTAATWPQQSVDIHAVALPPLQRPAGERPEATGRRLARQVAAQWSSDVAEKAR